MLALKKLTWSKNCCFIFLNHYKCNVFCENQREIIKNYKTKHQKEWPDNGQQKATQVGTKSISRKPKENYTYVPNPSGSSVRAVSFSVSVVSDRIAQNDGGNLIKTRNTSCI